ncbi:MAG: ABC transporter permease [Armatimonadetes bacterium]|nr:ABC transporter permease [Armatimonadota bacterium]
MRTYLVRRLISSLLTLWLVLTLVFVVMRLAPGDPAAALLGDYATDELLAQVRGWMGLDQPIPVQYWRFLDQLARGDLGYSYVQSAHVADMLVQQYPYTLHLTAAAMLVALLIGIPTGIFAALRRNTLWDLLAMGASFLPLAAPTFWLGLLLLLLFAIRWPLFPLLGAGDPANPAQMLYHLVLPAVAQGARFAAVLTRFVRSAMLNVLSEDYVRTARAKGLAERRVTYAHALRNALIPVVTLVGIDLILLLGGAVVTETVFSRPGVGKLVVDAVLSRDYATLQGAVLAIAVFVVIVNGLVDLTYALIDPRIRYA